MSNASFSPSQDPSVTQLTSAPQGGLAEFNPFSEVGELACFSESWGPLVVPRPPGQGTMAEKEAALKILKGTVLI